MNTRVHFRMRSYQLRSYNAFRSREYKRFLEVWHRRAGKDRTWLGITLTAMLERVGVYFHVFPSLNQGRRDMWDNIVHEKDETGRERSLKMMDMFPPELIVASDESEMQKTLINGSLWQIMGADSQEQIDRLRGPNPVGVVFSEYATMLPQAYDVLSPVLAENGGWASFIYTPKGKNHGYDRYREACKDPSWSHQLLTIDDTRRDSVGEDNSPVIRVEEIEALRRQGIREEFIQQEFYCSFEGYQLGTIYGDLVRRARAEGRVCNLPWVSQLPVGVMFDIGRSDATAMIFFQTVGSEIRFIDYYANSRLGADHYAKVLKEKPYIYGRLVLPHDAHVKGFTSTESTAEFLRRTVCRYVDVGKKYPVQLGIDAVRRMFSRFYFDQVKCQSDPAPNQPSLLTCLEAYHRNFDDKLGDSLGEPVHDKHSHGADSLRTGIMEWDDMGLRFIETNVPEVKVESTFDPRVELTKR